MLKIILSLLLFVFKLFNIYFFVISLFYLFSKKEETYIEKKLRFAILIAARNEESCIKNIIDSVKKQNYPKELIDIYVIPNNCTDRTEDIAKENGANIINVSDEIKGKGMALDFAMDMLKDKYDAFAVFDADNEINTDFIFNINQMLCKGFRVVKSKILAKNRKDSWVATCYDIHFCNANLFLNRARKNIGLSARLIGTGFAITTDFFKEIGGFKTKTITEDAEFYVICSCKGEKIGFCEKAIVYDEEPLDFTISLIQRKRWMSGIMEVTKIKFLDLIKGIFNKKSFLFSLDAFLQFIFCYLQAILPFIILLTFLVTPQQFFVEVIVLSIKFYTTVLIIGIIVQYLENRIEFNKNIILGILLYPIFVFTFIPLETISLFKKTVNWKEIKHTGVICSEFEQLDNDIVLR